MGTLRRPAAGGTVRTESATGWSELARWRPDPRLSGLVTGVCGYRERSRAPVTRQPPAASTIPVILSFGDTLEVDLSGRPAAWFGSFVAGLHPGPAHLSHQGRQGGLQIDLTPLGAFRLLQVPGAALAHQVVPLDAAAPGLGGPLLCERLASLPGWEPRFRLLDEVLVGLAAAGPRPDPMVAWMWRRLQASRGRARVASLVAETGYSHRHVAARFREQVGLGPKAAAGLIRFEAAADAARAGEAPLAEVAAAAGYADQSHLTRDFLRLAGHTPAAYRRGEVSYLRHSS